MRKPYPSDITDEHWAVVEPLIPVKKTGRPRTNEMREVLNALLYLKRSGCQWDMLPHDLPARSTVYNYFAQWREDGTWERIMDALQQGRGTTSRGPSPNARRIDSPMLKRTELGGRPRSDGARSLPA